MSDRPDTFHPQIQIYIKTLTLTTLPATHSRHPPPSTCEPILQNQLCHADNITPRSPAHRASRATPPNSQPKISATSDGPLLAATPAKSESANPEQSRTPPSLLQSRPRPPRSPRSPLPSPALTPFLHQQPPLTDPPSRPLPTSSDQHFEHQPPPVPVTVLRSLDPNVANVRISTAIFSSDPPTSGVGRPSIKPPAGSDLPCQRTPPPKPLCAARRSPDAAQSRVSGRFHLARSLLQTATSPPVPAPPFRSTAHASPDVSPPREP